MKKVLALILALAVCFGHVGCGNGVKLDENEVIVGNGTWQITKDGSVYTIMDNNVKKDDAVLYEINNIKTYNLYALGEYLYVNTLDGAMQLKLDGSKKSKFGSGDIIAAGGKYLYYQSSDNKVKSMIVYKINMVDGSQIQLFQDTIVSVELIDHGVFLFTGESGNEYVNELGSDEGMFYSQWLGEDATTPTE